LIVALVLVSAFLHALWNALLRLEKDKDRALVMAVAVATVVAAVVASIRWSVTGEPPFTTLAAVVWALAAGVLEWAYFTCLSRALDKGPLGPVYTISRGGSILLVWPTSVAVFSEPLTIASAIGSAVVLVGLATASTSGDSRRARAGVLGWAIACAASIAGYHLAYKAALREGGGPSAVFALALALASVINIARLGRDGRAVARSLMLQRTIRVLAMGLVCSGSFLILLEALAAGGAGFVLTLRNTSVLFAIPLAAMVGDRPQRLQIGGAALVAVGAIVMAWS
jgi:drug/metabolite transporter (DMT)-like permease